jgi:hypothetical protein
MSPMVQEHFAIESLCTRKTSKHSRMLFKLLQNFVVQSVLLSSTESNNPQTHTHMKPVVKPFTTDCFGNSFDSLTIAQLIQLRDTIQLEIKQYSFYKEGMRYQKKQRATLALLQSLTIA